MPTEPNITNAENSEPNDRTLSADRSSPPSFIEYDHVVGSAGYLKTHRLFSRLFNFKPAVDYDMAQTLGMASWQGDPLCDRALVDMREQGANPHAIIESFIE